MHVCIYVSICMCRWSLLSSRQTRCGPLSCCMTLFVLSLFAVLNCELWSLFSLNCNTCTANPIFLIYIYMYVYIYTYRIFNIFFRNFRLITPAFSTCWTFWECWKSATLTHFGHFLTSCWTFGNAWKSVTLTHFGHFFDNMLDFWDRFQVILGSFSGHLGVVFGSSWGRFRLVLGSFSNHLGIISHGFGDLSPDSIWIHMVCGSLSPHKYMCVCVCPSFETGMPTGMAALRILQNR